MAALPIADTAPLLDAPIPGASVLDNAVWHSLVGSHLALAEARRDAARYRPDVSVFSALPDDAGIRAWASLAELTGPDGRAVLFRGEVAPRPGWVVEHEVPGVQLVASRRLGRADPDVVALGPDLADDAAALVRRTRPGPWRSRSLELGRYVGLEHDGRLVAMAGQRLQPPGWCEISAVCTEPEVRRRGFATRLALHVAHLIETSGRVPFIHAATDNVDAIRLYEELGFVHRRDVTATVLRPPRRIAS